MKIQNLNTSFKIFEDLSRNYHDRYQYIFPDFNFKKYIEIPEKYNGNLILIHMDIIKIMIQILYEAVITNDFLFNQMNI